MISISHPQWDPPLTLNNRLGAMYTSKSQKSRVLTELWVEDNMYCLVCGNCSVSKYPANMPVADFLRPSCWTVDELKENPHILEMKKNYPRRRKNTTTIADAPGSRIDPIYFSRHVL